MSSKSRFADGHPGRMSMPSTPGSQAVSSIEATDEDEEDLDSDEHNMIIENISKYSNGFNLISQIKDNNSSASSSRQNTPLINSRLTNPAETAKKAMDVQGNLLGYLKNIPNQEGFTSPVQHKKTTSVMNSLRQMQ